MEKSILAGSSVSSALLCAHIMVGTMMENGPCFPFDFMSESSADCRTSRLLWLSSKHLSDCREDICIYCSLGICSSFFSCLHSIYVEV